MSENPKPTTEPPEEDPNAALKTGSGGPIWRFCLYVAGDSPHSMLALHNLRGICEEFLSGRCEVEVINVLAEPGRALSDGVVVTPTLVKLSPPPASRLMGNLSNRQTVLLMLGLQDQADRERNRG